MSELNFDDKTKEAEEAIGVEEAEEARLAQEKADKEKAEAEEARKAAEAALAKKVAAEAGAPVNSTNSEELDQAWRNHCTRFGYNTSTPRPADWNPEGCLLYTSTLPTN